jgi:predicted dehydrogenase
MYILCDEWEDGYLDYYRPEEYVRIQVHSWWIIQSIQDMFHEQPRKWRRIWNYIGEYGPAMVVRKILARSGEKFRDRKVLATGLGTIVESDSTGFFAKGQKVVFIAPCHPQCVERVVLPPELVEPVDLKVFGRVVRHRGVILNRKAMSEKRFDELAGWSEYSGRELPKVSGLLLQNALEHWSNFDASEATTLEISEPSQIKERMSASNSKSGDFKAVLFAWGNHAKTIILPNINPRIKVVCVHEIDPVRLGKVNSLSWDADTAPFPRPDEHYDVYLIAGFHNSHASQAAYALKSGAWAVVEKPLVTTWAELSLLKEALEQNPGRYFAGFHMRYNCLWKLALKDLNLREGEPIHYHCIVYEIPNPRKHWYNWPIARSRIVSNGCHWIDHFLFLNKFSKPERYDLWKGKNGDLHASIELENGAVFGMHLTEQGSKRIGVQDYIELRANGVTIRVCKGSRYISENNQRIIRRCRVNKLNAYQEMYRHICEAIVQGKVGDSITSIELSSEMMLRLEDIYTNLK